MYMCTRVHTKLKASEHVRSGAELGRGGPDFVLFLTQLNTGTGFGSEVLHA